MEAPYRCSCIPCVCRLEGKDSSGCPYRIHGPNVEQLKQLLAKQFPAGGYRFTVLDVLEAGREIWGEEKLTVQDIVVRLSVNLGKLARLARGATKDKPRDIKRELELAMGHIIMSSIRWADDLGLDVNHCILEALFAQADFARKNPER